MRSRHPNDTNEIKDRIQALVRDIVILRDKGCVLENVVDVFYIPKCNGFAKDGHLILQADHLITRANSETYADTRLIVCICKGHHGWKNWNKEHYDEVIRQILPADRVMLWDKAMAHRYQVHRKFTHDWRLEEAALKQELIHLRQNEGASQIMIRY